MNISTKLTQTHRLTLFIEKRLVCQGRGEVGEGRIGSLGLTDANYYI